MKNDKAFYPSGITALRTICIVFLTHHTAHLIQEFSRFLVSINLLIFHDKLRYIQKCQKSIINILIADIIKLVLNTQWLTRLRHVNVELSEARLRHARLAVAPSARQPVVRVVPFSRHNQPASRFYYAGKNSAQLNIIFYLNQFRIIKMLPDFPIIKSRWSKIFLKFMKEQMHRSSIMAEIKTDPHFEGNRMSTKHDEGDVDKSNYNLLSTELSVKTDDIIKFGFKAFIMGLNKAAEELKSQQSKMVFEKLSEVTTKTGNIVDAGGQPISHDLLLKTLETIQLDFDDNGKPSMPTMVVSPQQYEKIKEKIVEWENDPECQKQFEQTINQKRKEWHDRESNRKLVD